MASHVRHRWPLLATAVITATCGPTGTSAPPSTTQPAAPRSTPSATAPVDTTPVGTAPPTSAAVIHEVVTDTVPPGLTEDPLTDASEPASESWEPRTFNNLVHAADFTMLGTAISVQAHVDTDGTTLSHLAIELDPDSGWGSWPELIYAQQLPPTAEATVTDLPAEVPDARRFGPQLTVGDRVLVLLEWHTIATADGPWQVLMPVGGYQGTWVLADGVATSDDPLRTVPETDLVDRLEREWSFGQVLPGSSANEQAFAETTRRNPLGDGTVEPPHLLVGSRESPPLAVLDVAHPEAVTVAAPPPHGDITAWFGPDTGGGFMLQLFAGEQPLTSVGSGSTDSLSGQATVTHLPGDEYVALAALGAPGTTADGVVATILNGETVDVATVVSPMEQRVVVIAVVPFGAAGLSVTGLGGDGAVQFTLPGPACEYVADACTPTTPAG